MSYKNHKRHAGTITIMRNLIARLRTVGSMSTSQYMGWADISKTAAIEHLALLLDERIVKRSSEKNASSSRKVFVYRMLANDAEVVAFMRKLEKEASEYTTSRLVGLESAARDRHIEESARDSRTPFYDPFALPREFFGAPAVAA